MLKWCIRYKDAPRTEVCTEEVAPRDAVVKRFEDAKRLATHNGRAVAGMWLIDRDTEHEEVIEIHGHVPAQIDIQYRGYMMKSGRLGGEPDPRPYKVDRTTEDGEFVSRIAEYATLKEALSHLYHKREPGLHYAVGVWPTRPRQ